MIAYRCMLPGGGVHTTTKQVFPRLQSYGVGRKHNSSWLQKLHRGSHRSKRRKLCVANVATSTTGEDKESTESVEHYLDIERHKRGPLDDEYVLGLIWQQRKRLSIAVVCLLCCVASNVASPVLSGLLFDSLIRRQPIQNFGRVLLILTASYFFEPILSAVYVNACCKAADEVVSFLRCELFRVLMLQRIEFFDRHSSSELSGLVGEGLDAIRNFVYGNVTRDRGLRAVLEALGATVVLFAISWRLGPVMAGVIVTTGMTVALYRLQTKAAESARAASVGRMVEVAQQALGGIRTVRSYGGEAFERERFVNYVHQNFESSAKLGKAKSVMELLNRGCVHVSLLSLYGLGGWLIHNGYLPLSVLLTGIGFTYSLVYATQGIVQTSADWRKVTTTLDRIQSVLSESRTDPAMSAVLPPGAWWDVANAPENNNNKNNVAPCSNNGRQATAVHRNGGNGADTAAMEAAKRGPLELRDISFAYPLRPNVQVLQGLSLILPRGTITAVVGRSGSGKSTVASLISRFYQPGKGAIFLGGQNANDFTQPEWTRAVAMVSQEPVLFAGTIADNIAYGNLCHASQSDIEAAARAANAHDFIEQLPEGYGTRVGEQGALLSGGQRQRVAIARALLKDSPILILDEATSALDATSERLVQQAIEYLVNGRTVLIIAHRLSTVQAADQIVVLDGGRCVEVGTHTELLARQGVYTELISSQSLTISGT